MTEKVFTIKNRLGLHARPAALFVQEAAKFKSHILVVKDGLEVNGKSVMGLMLLAAEGGSKLTVKADGPDEAQAIEAIVKIFDRKFDED
ncbi:MAG: phosphocarrier protein HPr [Elusimicrobia bacterium GWC2_65_9]|nr:MAG: phosphocarrier protein HPr [Elusimicrobia bacterium GWA2_66_18]OGR74055.1 MAG: phosphocarrier protein HPr [Elusimicrobia bacterium GWC2_65_9]